MWVPYHAAVADQHQPLDAELVLMTCTIWANALGSSVLPANTRIATGRCRGREHAVFDLLAALLAVARVAARGQLAAPPGHPRGSQVEQRHPAWVHRSARCLAASFFSILPCRAASQSIAA